MYLPESEIFKAYVELAKQAGLVKESDYADARIGSDTKEVIEMLYGVRPDDEKTEQNYNPLVEKAHPEPVVLLPAHDRFNGILENINERQSIMAYISRKTPDGSLIGRRYVKAKEDLLNTLVRVGFTMDNEGKTDLAKFADGCSERLVKEGQWLIGGLIVGALGLIALINHTDFARQNVSQNAQEVLNELGDISDNPLASTIQTSVQKLKDMADQIQPIEANLASLQSIVQTAKVNDSQLQQMQDYRDYMATVEKQIGVWESELSATPTQSESGPNWWEEIKGVADFFVSSDTDDVVRALGGLSKAIDAANNEMNMYMQKAAALRPNVEAFLQSHPDFAESTSQTLAANKQNQGNTQNSDYSTLPTKLQDV